MTIGHSARIDSGIAQTDKASPLAHLLWMASVDSKPLIGRKRSMF